MIFHQVHQPMQSSATVAAHKTSQMMMMMKKMMGTNQNDLI
jgi:hypothetical protein